MKSTIKNKNNNIIEISFDDKNSYIRLQKLENNIFCAITTFVDPTQRGKGIGNKLYDEMIKYIKSNNAKFKATCPFIVDKAKEDKNIKDIYLA